LKSLAGASQFSKACVLFNIPASVAINELLCPLAGALFPSAILMLSPLTLRCSHQFIVRTFTYPFKFCKKHPIFRFKPLKAKGKDPMGLFCPFLM
jgi:hypothetical protein